MIDSMTLGRSVYLSGLPPFSPGQDALGTGFNIFFSSSSIPLFFFYPIQNIYENSKYKSGERGAV